MVTLLRIFVTNSAAISVVVRINPNAHGRQTQFVIGEP
jgi:hypothetical protein